MQDVFSYLKSGAEKACNFILGSRDVFEYAKLAGMFILQPASMTFGLFLNHVIGTLEDPLPCDPAELSADDLLYYATLAALSESVYQVAEDNEGEAKPYQKQPNQLNNENNQHQKEEIENKDTFFLLRRKKQQKKIPEEAGDILYEAKESKIDRTPYIVTYSKKYNKIFVAIRGSYTFADFITDLKLSAVQVGDTLMHSGVFSASNALFARTEEHLIQLSKDYGNCPIVFTGHSLGGSVAASTARFFRLKHPDLPVYAVCFAPIASLGIEGANQTLEYITSFVLGGDPVPFLSLHNVAQVSETGYRWINRIIEEALLREVPRTIELPKDLDMFSNPFELPPPSLDKIKEDVSVSSRRTTALFPPGKCFHIAYEGETFKHVSLENISDSIEYFSALRNNSNDDHHGIKLYKDSLYELHRISLLSQPK